MYAQLIASGDVCPKCFGCCVGNNPGIGYCSHGISPQSGLCSKGITDH